MFQSFVTKMAFLVVIVVILSVPDESQAVLDRVYHNGTGWTSETISQANYKGLAGAVSAGDVLFGIRADGGGIEEVAMGVSWSAATTSLITGVSYKAISANPSVTGFFAARSDGTGVDKWTKSGTTWTSEFIINNDYKALADVAYGTYFAGSLANGSGIDFVNGDTKVVDSSYSTDYKALGFEGNASYALGALANGSGVSRRAITGETSSMGTRNYTAIGAVGWDVYYGIENRQLYKAWYGDGWSGFPTVTANYDSLGIIRGGSADSTGQNIIFVSTVPEPATIAILSLGVLLLNRKRK
jgi:hypothetical protein